MLKTKRVALSVRVSEHARDALYRKAEREGHRYALALAAVLLERAVEEPAAGTGRGEWLSDMGALARVFGGKVSVEGDRVILTLEPKTTATAVEWLRARVMVNHPPSDGIVFMVKIAGGS